eukprot:scaffold26_cov117-Cylindrotheca_fusiformis.AAC.13
MIRRCINLRALVLVGNPSPRSHYAYGVRTLIEAAGGSSGAPPIHCIPYNGFASQTKKRSGDLHRMRAQEFLRKLQENRIRGAVATQRVEELLLGMLKETNTPEDGPLSLELLNAAITYADLPNEKIVPRVFSLACQVMVRSGHPLALNELSRQIWRLIGKHKDFMTNDIAYNTHHVNDACAQYITLAVGKLGSHRRLDYRTAKQVERLIHRVKSMYDDPSIPLGPSADAFNAFIMYYSKLGKPEQALHQLQSMTEGNDLHQLRLEPRISSFSLVITAFANAGKPEKSLEIIQWMLSSSESEDSLIPAPNRTCFNGLLHAWAKSGHNSAGEKAEQVIEWMQQLNEVENLDTKPDEISFASCINAWAQSPGRDSPIRAEAILRQSLASQGGGSGITPSISAFSSVMDAWARSGREDAPAKVEAILDLVEEVYAAADKTELTPYPYTIMIKAWANAARQANDVVQKTAFSEMSLQVLSRMERNGITPPPAALNATIMALHEASAVYAVFYFLELEEKYRKGVIQLDTRTFNCGLNAIASMMKPDAAEKAMSMLQRMTGYSKQDASVCPDETTFNVILKVLSRSKAADSAARADQLLQDMTSMPSVKPSHISYSTCIIAWGRSADEEKFDRVRKLLLSYEKCHKGGKISGDLSLSVYNAALSVSYHNKAPQLQNQALETALCAMERLRTAKVAPDKTTYQSLFKLIRSLPSSMTRDELVETEFSNCASDGLVSQEVVSLVQEMSPKHIAKLLSDDIEAPISGAELPKAWSSRVGTLKRR